MSNDVLGSRNVSQINTTIIDDSDKVLYMFTSTAQPYIKDTLDLLALPVGVSYRFRYDVKWLPVDLFENENKIKLKSLKDQKSILVHVRTLPKPKLHGKISYEIIEFIPMREAKILEASMVGDFVWVYFLLGDWIDYSLLSKESQQLYHNKIKDVMSNPLKTELVYTALLSKKPDLQTIQEDLSADYHNSKVVSNWSTLINFIGSKSEHKNSIFIKLLSIEDIRNNNKLKPVKLSGSIYGFSLESEKTYQIRILQRSLNSPSPSFNLKIITNSDDILPIKDTDIVQGKYDIFRFIISPTPLLKSRYTFLLIQPEDDYPKEYKIAHCFFNIKINIQKKYLAGLLGGLTAALALSGLGSTIADVSGVKLLSTVLPILGGFGSAVIAYLMPKR